MSNYKDHIYKISAVLILLSAMFFFSHPEVASWTMAASVVVFSITTALTPYPGKSIRGKRLFNFQIISCLLMFVSVYLMFANNNAWPLAMIIAAIFLLYAAVFIPKELKKEGFEENR